MLDRQDQTSLIWLQWHWGSHYSVAVIDGRWQAHPMDAPAELLIAESPSALRELMRNDHAQRASRSSRPDH